MILYHGTNVKSIGLILEQRKLIGTRKVKTHKHAYLSFTPILSFAHNYGLIILAFKNIESRVTPVNDFDFDWACRNKEIFEYVDGQVYETHSDIREAGVWENGPKNPSKLTEYVHMNEFSFQPHEVKVMVCGSVERERKEIYQKIQTLYGQEYEIIEQDSVNIDSAGLGVYFYDNFLRYDLINQDFYNGYKVNDLLSGL